MMRMIKYFIRCKVLTHQDLQGTLLKLHTLNMMILLEKMSYYMLC